jgi:hypothetical protein
LIIKKLHFSITDIKYVIYVLSPTFRSSAGVLISLLLFALFALLLNTLSNSKLLATHMLIYIFASLCIPEIPGYMATDILLSTFVTLAITKGVGWLLDVGGKWEEGPGKWVGWGMVVVCAGLVMESVVEEGKGWKGLGREDSFVVGNLRGWLV